MNIQPITEPARIGVLLSLVEDFAESSYHLKLSFVQSRNWAVVPVESGLHFLPEDAELISLALHSIQCFECVAIATEDLSESCIGYQVTTTQAGLLEFNKECAHFNFALTSEDLSFVVLCTVADYYLVAGPADFVTKTVGKDIQAAKQDFFEFATDEGWRDKIREHLLAVYRRYQPFNGMGR